MAKYFPPKRDFSSLSVTDLLDAREAYHVHLAHLENVVATAVGRYRIRIDDPDAKLPTSAKDTNANTKNLPPRTFSNTIVQPWSWPCVMVFVNKWLSRDEFAKNPDQMVPRSLYLPDGRVVPTCVMYVEQSDAPAEQIPRPNFPSNLIGGGYVVLTDVQGREHVGSVGCLVTDGDQTYALTSRHVTGPGGREIFSMIRNERVAIGIADAKQLGKVPFEEVYTGWPGPRSFVNFDAGLIRIDDAARWTTQVFGVCQLAEPVDLNTETISLDLIGCPVRAFGGASGDLKGQIQAMFYRYRSIGGSDYIADLLIGSRPGAATPMKPLPGDSGTLWVFDPAENKSAPRQLSKGAKTAKPASDSSEPAPQLRPIALQWGGHTIMESATKQQFHFALATCLSTICRGLGVDVVRDWNAGRPEYWGERGHYTIGAKACDLVAHSKLRKLMRANVDRISFDESTIVSGDTDVEAGSAFFPLSDVPDTVWKVAPFKRVRENPNHFSDMDEPGKGIFAGKTLFKICEDPQKVQPGVWNDFYEALDIPPRYRGCLPFRVWQLFDEMVASVRAANIARFVAVAGVLAHYVGDACQPLHSSRLHDGTPGNDEEKGVHSAYESKMIDRYKSELYKGLNAALINQRASADVTNGHSAAISLITLMRKTASALTPEDIIEAYTQGNHRIAAMWSALGERTIKVVANGSLHLAMLWESAWHEGGGNAIPESKLKSIPKATLRTFYEDKNFAPSMYLPDLISAGILNIAP